MTQSSACSFRVALRNYYKFTSKERDSESGLDNFGARFNSSSLGRFLSPDQDNAGASPDVPQSWNAYSYVLNNPLSNTDPDGQACVSTDGGKTFHDDDSGGQSCKDAQQPQQITVTLNDDERARLIFAMAYESATNRRRYLQGAQDAIMAMGIGKAVWEAPGLIRAGWSLVTSLKFDEAVIDAVVQSSEREASSQITQGARALAKKAGHAAAEGTTSAFDGIAPTQENAAAAIRDIMSDPVRVVRGGRTTDIYNALGQGVRIENGTNKFVGFLEGSKASR